MSNKEYVFAGNRFYVLQEMLKQDLPVKKIFAVKKSWLEHALIEQGISYTALPPKKDFIEQLNNCEFDRFIANGLPYILPISKLSKGNNKQFINIHPSFLPDLRGADPQPGALLFGRDSGATCHMMNDAVDAGQIIARKRIPFHPGFDAGLLYALTFRAEVDVFKEALKRGFIPVGHQEEQADAVYYTFKEDDLKIDFTMPAEAIVRKVKAFNTPNKMARFAYNGVQWYVADAVIIENEFMDATFRNVRNNEVVLVYGNNLMVKKETSFLILKHITGTGSALPSVGAVLSETQRERASIYAMG